MDMQRYRAITKNHRCTAPRRIVAFACDYDEIADAQQPECSYYKWRGGSAVFVYVRDGQPQRMEQMETSDPAALCRWVLSWACGREPLYLFCDNLPLQFQISGMWQFLCGGGCRVERFLLSDPPNLVNWTTHRGRVVAADLVNYAGHRAAQVIADCLGSADQSEMRVLADAKREIPGRLAARGCASVAAVLAGLWGTARMGQWRSTLAGLAWSAYRHRFLRGAVPLHNCHRATALEREAYFGADVLPLHLGRAPGLVYSGDVNSLYPHVMAQEEYPCELLDYRDSGSLADLQRALAGGCVVASVRVRSPWDGYPVREAGVRKSVRGLFWAALSTPELRLLLARNAVSAVGRLAVYRRRVLFAEWSEYWYGLRRKYESAGLGGLAGICKLIANALSGKFAQRGSVWKPAPHIKAEKPFGEWWYRPAQGAPLQLCQAIGGRVNVQCGHDEWHSSFPAVSAHITAAGREHMRALRGIAGEYEVFYQDTDSLYLSSAGLARLSAAGVVSHSRMGAVRISGSPQELVVYGCKSYKYGQKEVHSGLKAARIVNDSGELTQQLTEGARQIIGHADSGTVQNRTAAFVVRESAINRQIAADGWTYPLQRGEV